MGLAVGVPVIVSWPLFSWSLLGVTGALGGALVIVKAGGAGTAGAEKQGSNEKILFLVTWSRTSTEKDNGKSHNSSNTCLRIELR